MKLNLKYTRGLVILVLAGNFILPNSEGVVVSWQITGFTLIKKTER